MSNALRSRALIFTVATTLLLASCSNGAAEDTEAEGQERGSLTYASDQAPDTFNPAMLVEHTNPVTEMVFRGLVSHDADNQIVPALATEWTVSDDELTYEFTLRDDVTWHDGETFTADDVVFTLDEVRDPASEAAVAANFDALTEITAADDTHVRIELSEPSAALLDALSMGILPEHLLGNSSVTDPDFGIAPVGTGPFRLVDFKNDQYAQLEAFDDYYAGAPGLDQVTITYVPDSTARAVQLANGEVDAAYIDPQQAQTVQEDDALSLDIFPTADYRGLLLNMEQPVFSDPELREALNYAVDREALVEAVLLGYGKPATSPLGMSDLEQPDLAPYTFDPDRVRELMTSAGYTRSGQGPWTKQGEPVSFTIATFAEDSVRVGLLEVVTTQLKEQGFDVTAEPLPRDAVKWEDLDAFVIGWGTPYHPDTSLFAPFHSSQALAEGGENLGSYRNTDVDDALMAGRRGDTDAYVDFQKAIAQDPPYVWLVYLEALNAFPADFSGPTERTLEHHGFGLFWDVETWHWT